MGRKALERPVLSEADRAVQDQFVRDICERPCDPVTRFIFADWLHDKGDYLWEDAIRSGKSGCVTHSRTTKNGMKGKQEIRDLLSPDIVAAICGKPVLHWCRVVGGFVEQVTCHWSDWKTLGPKLVAQCPITALAASGWLQFAECPPRRSQCWFLKLQAIGLEFPEVLPHVLDIGVGWSVGSRAFLKERLSPMFIRWARVKAGMKASWQDKE